MNQELKQRIISNQFIYALRLYAKVDDEAYRALCLDLAQLAQEWRSASCIDKEVMQHLYVLPAVVRDAAEYMTKAEHARAWDVEQMGITLDNLVVECLAS